MDEEAIILREISAIYEGESQPTIHDVSLSVPKGEFVAIIGPNAVGKTTLLESINGLIPHTEGELLIGGREVSRDGTTIRQDIGYVPQEVAFGVLSPYLVHQVVLMGRYGKIGLLRGPSEKDKQLADNALEEVGISELKSRPVGRLSGGQQQKVLIARMIAKEPDIVLLDEPFSNLDFKAKEEISSLVCNLHEELSLTILMVLHNLEAIPEICDRVVLMGEGTIQEKGTPEQILNSPLLQSVY